MPARHFSNVDLPDPFRPTIPKNSPGSTANETPRSACSSSERPRRNGCSARSLSVWTRSRGIRNDLLTSFTSTAGRACACTPGQASRGPPQRGLHRSASWTEMPDARTKRLTLVACVLGTAVVFLDGTVVNVALPAIRADLHGGLAAQQWVVEAYLLTLGSLLLVGGSLGDLLGRRRIFTIGLAGFGATSLLCAAAPSSEV